jgi:type IV pilus assembly protein PilM
MFTWLKQRRASPIGVDIGQRSIKLVQLSADRTRVVEAVRWDIAGDERPTAAHERDQQILTALAQAREGRRFAGKSAVLCLGASDLLIHNIRVPKSATTDLDRAVQQEAAGRVPFSMVEAEIRYLQAADVRQGEATVREIILLACHRPVLQRKLDLVIRAGLRPVAVDAEPLALVRCYARQFRRDEDRQRRLMFVHIGGCNSVVVIAQGSDPLFIKYLELGGKHLDEAVAAHLKMPLADASAMRRHNSDRRADQRDSEISRSLVDATRPVLDRLAHELSLCIRYHSVTFRGQPLAQAVIGGGEATTQLVENLASRINLKCELGDPLRTYTAAAEVPRKPQWDIAAGLALRELN